MGLDNYRRSVSEAKQASILQAGREIFLRDGFSRASVADIARRADVSTATLYKHFSSKEDLFAAVVRNAAQDLGDYASLLTTETNVEEIFITVTRAYLTMQFERKSNELMRILIAEAASNPKLVREAAEYMVERRLKSLQTVLETLIERGLLRPHDAALGARLASGMIKELFVWPALFDPDFAIPADADEKIRAAMAVYIARYGVRPHTGRAPD